MVIKSFAMNLKFVIKKLIFCRNLNTKIKKVPVVSFKFEGYQ